MEAATFPPPWARGGFISAGLVAVTQRRESCWGLSPPQGLPGRGPCHTLLLGGSFSELGWPGIQPAPLCPLGPSGHQCSCPLWSLMLVFPVSLWSPILLSPVSLWSLVLLSLLSPMLLSPFIPLVTSPMLLSPLSLVTVASVPFYPCGQRCLCPLHPCGHEAGFVPRGSAGCKGTPSAVGTCHQAPLRARGQGRDPIPCWSIWEPCSG